MAEELGKIEKPPVDSFKKGRRIFYVPVVYLGDEPEEEYRRLYDRYWDQVARQLEDLTLKLGAVARIYHELVAETGEAGQKSVEELNRASAALVKAFLEKNAGLEALEDADLLMEYMDWSRCLLIGLQNPRVIETVYSAYTAAGKKRTELLARKINETLKAEETGLVMLRENHQVQFPADVQVFYVSPPALDEIKRYLRDRQNKAGGTEDSERPGD